MSNTVTYAPGIINIVPDGTTDYDTKDFFPGGLKLIGVKFYTTTTTDIFSLSDGSAGGAIISQFTGTGKDVIPMGRWCFPYFDASDCTFASAAAVKIILEYI